MNLITDDVESTTMDFEIPIKVTYAPVRQTIINTVANTTTVYYLDELKQILDGKLVLSEAEKHIIAMCYIQELLNKGMTSLKEVDLKDKILICNREQAETHRFRKGEG